MERFVAGVSTVLVLLVLLAAGGGHLTRPRLLPAALRAHDLLPARLHVPVAAGVVVAELGLGALGTAAVLTGTGPGAALAAAAGLFAGYAGYTGYALTTGRTGPCGCAGSREVPLQRWVVIRAVMLAGVAGCGAVLGPPLGPGWPGGATDGVIVAAAAGTFALLLAQLPAAMHIPRRAGQART